MSGSLTGVGLLDSMVLSVVPFHYTEAFLLMTSITCLRTVHQFVTVRYGQTVHSFLTTHYAVPVHCRSLIY